LYTITLVIDRLPEVVHLAVDLHQHLVQVPSALRICAHPADPIFADLCPEHRAKSVPPKPDRLVTDGDASLVLQIFDIPERKRKSNIQCVFRGDAPTDSDFIRPPIHGVSAHPCDVLLRGNL
jgi:hypothetical protein